MNVITSATLRRVQDEYPDAADALEDWHTTLRRTIFGTFADIRDTFATASWVGPGDVIFNIRGNHSRLITRVNFPYQSFFLKHFLTHADYDHWQP